MTYRITEKIIVDIIKNQLGLPDDYGALQKDQQDVTRGIGGYASVSKVPSVFVRSQNLKLFNTTQLQISVGVVDSKVISNCSTQNFDVIPAVDVQQLVVLENVQVDLFSRDNSARDRRYEVISALKSYYSQQQQDLYQFRIFEIPMSFVNTGEADGGSELNRYTLVFPVHTIYTKTVNILTNDYYNKFSNIYIDDIQPTEPNGAFTF